MLINDPAFDIIEKNKGDVFVLKRIKSDPAVVIAVIVVTALAVSLIPIFAGAFFSHPISDDFKYARFVHTAVEENGAAGFLPSVFGTVADTYMNWQGTYSAAFLFALQPGGVYSGMYFLTTFIIVGSIVAAMYFLMYSLVRRVIGSKGVYAVILASLVLLLQFQFIPNKHEGLYWYNGAIYYSFFYALSLVYFALLLRYSQIKKRGLRVITGVLLFLLAAFIGGGNYTTLLVTIILTLFYVIGCFVKKSRGKWMFAALLAVLLLGFAVSALAPGNANRASQFDLSNPVVAIVKSYYYAMSCFASWTRLPELAFFVFSSPIVFLLARRAEFSFKYPLLVLVLSFSVFAAQLTPALYVMSGVGSGRQVDIYYYSYYLFVLSQMFYIIGWLQRRAGQTNFGGIKVLLRKYCALFFALYVIISFAGCIPYPISNMTSVDISLSLYRGEAQEYDRQYKEIEAKLNEDSDVCCIPEIKTVPDFYSKLLISDDGSYWVNQRMAHFYGHEKIVKID